MTRTTEAPIIQSLVQTIRANNSALNAATTSGTLHGIHEDIAPTGTKYPHLTYRFVYAPYDDDFSNRTIRAAVDIEATSESQVEASNLDSVVCTTVEDNLAAVTGQSILFCRRIAGIRLSEVTEEGKKIYRVGGTYSIWTDQPL
jgi:hypothetical protein